MLVHVPTDIWELAARDNWEPPKTTAMLYLLTAEAPTALGLWAATALAPSQARAIYERYRNLIDENRGQNELPALGEWITADGKASTEDEGEI